MTRRPDGTVVDTPCPDYERDYTFVSLSHPDIQFISGSVIFVDGAEAVVAYPKA